MHHKQALWGIIPGAILLFLYGCRVCEGKATTNVWVFCIGGFAMFVLGLLLFFGIIKEDSNIIPREEHVKAFFCLFFAGLCALAKWIARDFAFDDDTITSILLLAFMVAIAIKQKHRKINRPH